MLYKDHDLNGTQGPVKIIRVTFTTYVYDFWDFNSVEILNTVKSIFF